MPKHVHSPFPASLRSECKKAANILNSFINPDAITSPGRELPKDALAKAKGLVIFTVAKAGFIFSARFGSGLLIARLDDGTWSAPSAIGTFGGGIGGMGGVELTDLVFILKDRRSVKAFSQLISGTMGLNLSLAFGPGRDAEASMGLSAGGVGGMQAYSSAKGVYMGGSYEFGVMIEGRGANAKMYQRDRVTAGQLLSGKVRPVKAEDTESLMRVLNSVAFRSTSGSGSKREVPAELGVGAQNQPPAEVHGWDDAAVGRGELEAQRAQINEVQGDSGVELDAAQRTQVSEVLGDVDVVGRVELSAESEVTVAPSVRGAAPGTLQSENPSSSTSGQHSGEPLQGRKPAASGILKAEGPSTNGQFSGEPSVALLVVGSPSERSDPPRESGR